MVTIAIDIGNTRTHVGIIDLQYYRCISSTAFSVKETESRLISTIKDMIVSVNLPVISKVAISCVVRKYYDISYNILLKNSYEPFFVDVKQIKSLKVNYKIPEKIGTDRIANALAAVRYKKMPSILISIGTAIVIDVISDNTFLGGFIMPGLRLQLEALNNSTDLLPLVNFSEQLNYTIPPSSTEECIGGGVIEGTAYAINGLVKRLCDKLSFKPYIISTGGDWYLLKKFISFNYEEIPELTLVGTASFLEEIGEG
ncbi:MAG: type III pantothenate kinase [Chitinispirillaceae bacterium]|nr:type III pantothenate kinase [Chitinispirillaceae bacterium]